MYVIVSLDSALFEGINLVLKNTEGNTIGGIMGQINEGYQGYITHLWIDVSKQGKGLGRQLVTAFEQSSMRGTLFSSVCRYFCPPSPPIL